MYYDDRYGQDLLCRRNGRERRVDYAVARLFSKLGTGPDPRSGRDRRYEHCRSTPRAGVVEPIIIALILLAGGTVLGYFIALASTTTYLP